MSWKPVPFAEKLFTNVAETVLTKSNSALENAFVNESGGLTRFPGLKDFVTLPQSGRVYISKYKTDLIAASELSRLYRIDKDGNIEDVTEVPITGGKRVIFAETRSELVCAAGGPLIRFAGHKTELLSEDAPQSAFVTFIDDFILAAESDSGLFQHSSDNARTWNALDTFAANGNPDNISAMIVTPFGEVIVGGEASIEQFERLTNGSVPFFRRWSVGEGLRAPYTLIPADNAIWFINDKFEFVRTSGQISSSRGDDLGRTFEKVGDTDWEDAWAVPLNIVGQKLILLQIPNATNVYGTKGITVIFDYRQNKWFSLYGWDIENGVPIRWPGWSYFSWWGRHFVGGEGGKIYELDEDTFTNGGQIQKILGRTAHIKDWGESRINNVRMNITRGTVAPNETEPVIWLRAIKDNSKTTRFVQKNLGASGERNVVVEFGAMGIANTWQFEYMTTGACKLDITKMEVDVERIGRG